MPADSRGFYHSSSSSGASRTNTHEVRNDDGGYDVHDLPSIRDVVGEQLNTPLPHHPAYNLSARQDASPEVRRNTHSSLPGPMLPPITRYESSSESRHGGRENTQHDLDYHRNPSVRPTPNPLRDQLGRHPVGHGSYHVFAQSDTRGALIPVSSSSSPQGIMRDRSIPVGPQPGVDDSRKRFECHLCGRKMERQSVFNQHMITHTDERPHICTICGKSFNSKSNLNRHALTHGPKSSRNEDASEGGGGSSSKTYYSSSYRK